MSREVKRFEKLRARQRELENLRSKLEGQKEDAERRVEDVVAKMEERGVDPETISDSIQELREQIEVEEKKLAEDLDTAEAKLREVREKVESAA